MTGPATSSGDIVDLLLSQHQQVKQAMAEVQDSAGDAQADAFDRLKLLLHAHEQGEQQVVHPVTRDAANGAGVA